MNDNLLLEQLERQLEVASLSGEVQAVMRGIVEHLMRLEGADGASLLLPLPPLSSSLSAKRGNPHDSGKRLSRCFYIGDLGSAHHPKARLFGAIFTT